MSGVDYDVAVEILATENGQLSQALIAEKSKAAPNQLLINYYNTRITAVADLAYDFRSSDDDIINAIFNLKRIFGCRRND